MRQVGAIIVCIFLLSLVNSGYVVSEVHGLSIGFSEGAEFHYTFPDHPQMDDYYIVVDEIGALPDNITDTSHVSVDSHIVNFTGYWSNGTEMPENYDMMAFWGFLPIGNWTYIKTLNPTILTLIDTEDLFGYDRSTEGHPDYGTYWKADGALYELHVVWGAEWHILRTDDSTSTTTTPETTTTTPTTSTEPTDGTSGPSLFDMPEILLISFAGVGVILIVAIVLIKKR